MLALLVLATPALRLSSRSPISQHTVEAFSVLRYYPGVNEVILDFETTGSPQLHRVNAVVHTDVVRFLKV